MQNKKVFPHSKEAHRSFDRSGTCGSDPQVERNISQKKMRRAQILLKADANAPTGSMPVSSRLRGHIKTAEDALQRLVKRDFSETQEEAKPQPHPGAKSFDGEQEAA